jgi:membrane protease YdiL (CAAX protease family)
MNDEPEPVPPVVAAVEMPPTVTLVPHKGWTKLSWLVIVAFVGCIIGLRLMSTPGDAHEVPLAIRVDLKMMQVQMQCLVALKDTYKTLDAHGMYDSIAAAADDDPAKRLRISAFAAEMIDPKEALAQLDAIAHPDQLAADDARLLDILRRLYRDQQRGLFYHPGVNDADAQWLEEKLGWVGAMALVPSMSETTLKQHEEAAGQLGPVMLEQYRQGREAMLNGAMRTLIITLSAVCAVILLLTLGFIALPIFLLIWAAGMFRIGLKPGIAHGGVYAETFALWLVFYGGLLIGGELMPHDLVPIVVRGVLAMPLSLVVVIWPVLRGIPWRQVRQDIGWTLGRQPLLEPLCGFACYIVNVPLVVGGFIVTVVLAAGYALLQQQIAGGGGEPAPPSHPVLEQLAHPDWPSLLLFFFLLSVVAPVVEETMFRGFLHRHLREVFFTRRPFLGGLATALTVNIIFAAVHPQGLLFVPVLTALACGFSVAREWRGTLIPSMVAHGTNNFLVGLLAVLLLGR